MLTSGEKQAKNVLVVKEKFVNIVKKPTKTFQNFQEILLSPS
jgi:hypothetical protein